MGTNMGTCPRGPEMSIVGGFIFQSLEYGWSSLSSLFSFVSVFSETEDIKFLEPHFMEVRHMEMSPSTSCQPCSWPPAPLAHRFFPYVSGPGQ